MLRVKIQLRLMTASVLMALTGLTFTGITLAQKVCDHMPIATMAKFAQGAVALDMAQRLEISSELNRSLQYSLNYVLIEPKASESEGTKAQRENIARRRGQYIRDFFVHAGVPSGSTKVSLDYALSTDSPPDHWANRATQISIFVHDPTALQRCLN